MRRNFVLAALCFLALASCGGPPPAPQKAAQPANAGYLGGQALAHALEGRRLSGASRNGTPYTLAFTPGGTGTVTTSGTANRMTWNINGDVLCLAVTVSGRPLHECDRVRITGGKYDFVDATTGALNNTYTPM